MGRCVRCGVRGCVRRSRREPRWRRQRAKRPQPAGVDESRVAFEPCDYRLGGARGDGDGRSAGVVAARFGILVAVRGIAELCEHPGAEDVSEPGKAEDQLGVRVLVKTFDKPRFNLGDLSVERRDDRHQSGCGGAESVSDQGRCLELVGAQRI